MLSLFEPGFAIVRTIFEFLLPFLVVLGALIAVFLLLCSCWWAYFRWISKLEWTPSEYIRVKRRSVLQQLLFDVPRRYTLDKFEREAGMFMEHGIHMFCGEQGSGKTIGCVEMMMRLHKSYPRSKAISNFGVAFEDDPLEEWQQLLTYNNGKQGVIVGIDEIQNWFMSGNNKLPPDMLEVVTQNRKNRRVICCTAQVFTRVNKAIREQVRFVYFPHTFLGCFTVIFKKKPVFDSEGNCIELKHKGIYAFTHTDELRSAYDTYKVIHTLAKEGFKDPLPQHTTNVYVTDGNRRK